MEKKEQGFLNKKHFEDAKIKAKIEFEKKKDEVIGSLKNLGNSILGDLTRQVRHELGQLQNAAESSGRLQHVLSELIQNNKITHGIPEMASRSSQF